MAQDFDSVTDMRHIKSEIERTRIEMSETLGEIQDRLRPDHLLQQARDGVTHAAAGKVKTMMNSAGETASMMATRARHAGTSVAGYAATHPLHVALAVGAATWWLLRGRSQSTMWHGAAETHWDDVEPVSYPESRTLRDKVGDYASDARQAVGDYASSARGAVGEYADSARSSARRASERVRGAASSATTSVDDWVRHNPMAAGAVALAVGVAIGLSVPSTDWENTTMGEARDRAWKKATRAARSIKDNVTDTVAAAAENIVSEGIADAAAMPRDSVGHA